VKESSQENPHVVSFFLDPDFECEPTQTLLNHGGIMPEYLPACSATQIVSLPRFFVRTGLALETARAKIVLIRSPLAEQTAMLPALNEQ
jgi:hypothetical protein